MKIHDAQNYEGKQCLLQITHNFFWVKFQCYDLIFLIYTFSMYLNS